MGHTLIACFDTHDFGQVTRSLSAFSGPSPNKIPFGRDCNREEANLVLPYHMTLFHWSRQWDERMLKRTEAITLSPCSVSVTGAHIMHAEEGSSLLYFSVEPGEAFAGWARKLEQTLGMAASSFLHITIAVGKDESEITRIRERLEEDLEYPFPLRISSLELYHIWRPCRWVRAWNIGSF